MNPSPQLLLVDDDPIAIQAMSRMLADYPAQRFATSGQEALRLARESTPDLVLLDVEMPGTSGFDVCSAFKADPALAAVPVIFATSHGSTASEVVALQHGAADFVTKPLEHAQLTARVRAQLRLRAARSARLHEPPEGAPASEGERLLVVDRDPAAVHLLRNALAELGDFHYALSGADALERVARLQPDLILLGGALSDTDGLALCRVLAAQPALQHVPIVCLVPARDADDVLRAFESGAVDVVAWPDRQALLAARVRNLLGRKRRSDEALLDLKRQWRRLSDRRVADIVAAASDALLSYDADGRIVYANEAAGRLFGLGAEGAIGLPVERLLGCRPDRQAAEPAGRTRLCLLRPAGGSVPAEMSVSCLDEGRDRLVTVMLRDTSLEDRLEAESRARATAEAASRTKTMMLSYLAHELGNPLNGLLGFAQLMAEDGRHPLPPEQARRLGHVTTCAQRLDTLLQDLLDLGRFESGQLAVTAAPVSVAEALRRAVEAVAPLAAQGEVRFERPREAGPLVLHADPDRLHQCLGNLLSNAIKYNRPGGRVGIETRARGAFVEIAVRDEGPGMEAGQLAHLFEPFNRLGQRAVPGAGLGLLITRQLLQAMGGTLRVDSRAGEGSCFTVVLPAAPATASAPTPHDRDARSPD